jgi:hypothetical protein
MDSSSFDKLTRLAAADTSRRAALRSAVASALAGLGVAALRGLVAGAVAAGGLGVTAKSGAAGKASRRRKRRLQRQARHRRRRCLDACGEACALCFFDARGEIVCGDNAGATCSEAAFCTAESTAAVCGSLFCLAKVQIRGSAEIQRFGTGFCEQPDGLCATVSPCAP